ncbi:hypothetical protein N9L92_01125 [Saprospiraceae bacterium]|nr:hypothetical protein [Saprospiraceae bacterium]
MKRITIGFLLFSVLFLISTNMDAQRRSSKRSSDRSSRTERTSSRSNDDDTERIGIKDRLAYDLFLGNVGLGQGFQLSGKVGAGYKPIERITAGLGAKFFYSFINLPGPDNFSSFSYGAYPYARFKITESIYIKGEYTYFNIDGGNGDNATPWIPFIGGGYTSGFGPWKFGLELLLIVNDLDRDTYFGGDLFEYTFGATYNF